MTEQLTELIGVVVIGRNEGERLRRCLESVAAGAAARTMPSPVVYVDSGSTDGSVALARSFGVEAVELDISTPFTAARARNAGVNRLVQLHPQIKFVQVMDGDCELIPNWLERAVLEMQSRSDVAVICGRRRERCPEHSIYNRLCDMEWNTAIGEAQACGGDALIRVAAFRQVGGYDESIIAGEEPEMCLRMRLAGWRILRIDHEMTLHDAQITRFGQWWKRMVRSGHAYAEGRARHGAAHRYCVHEVRSIVEWGFLLPLIALGLAWFTWGLSLLLFGSYLALLHRVRGHRIQHGDSPQDASLYAGYCVLGKFAQFVGLVKYWWNRIRGRRTRIIDYKSDQSIAPSTFAEARKA